MLGEEEGEEEVTQLEKRAVCWRKKKRRREKEGGTFLYSASRLTELALLVGVD